MGEPTVAMKRRYLTPFTVALSGHLLLLFGFASPERVPGPDPGPDAESDEPATILMVHEDDILPVADDGGAPAPQAEEARPVPGAPEPIPHPNPDGPVITLPRPGPVVLADSKLNIVPQQWSTGGEGDGLGGPLVLSAHHLDNAPAVRHQAPPAYPYAARQAGRTGEVVVEFIVNERGQVLMPRILRSTDPEFNEPTLRAVAKWRFEPGRKDGRPVRFRMNVPVLFNVSH